MFCELFSISERGKLADPFYRLEHQEEDLKKKKEAEPVLVRLQRMSDTRHSDDYALNKALRAQLRVRFLELTHPFLSSHIAMFRNCLICLQNSSLSPAAGSKEKSS